jgi:hypothetical protein
MLYSYKMTHDTGFAPNPFHNILSLANCKPQIRKKKKIGDFIAGFTSKRLCNDKVGHERMIYIMKVTEKISYDEYWNNPRFQSKKPTDANTITKAGDNIYKPIRNFDFFDINNYEQIENRHHKHENMPRDLNGQFILLSTDFFYFGVGAIPIDTFKINIPRGRLGHGIKTGDEIEIQNLWNYLKNNYPQNIPINRPHKWPNENFNTDENNFK